MDKKQWHANCHESTCDISPSTNNMIIIHIDQINMGIIYK
jgi:hypothetical protein